MAKTNMPGQADEFDEIRLRSQHWGKSLMMMYVVVGVLCLATLLLFFFLSQINKIVVFGFPLGFFLIAQGLVILTVVLAFWLAERQDHIDHDIDLGEDHWTN